MLADVEACPAIGRARNPLHTRQMFRRQVRLSTSIATSPGLIKATSSGRNYLAYHRLSPAVYKLSEFYLLFDRGSTGSYQRWANIAGDQSYTFENLLTHFKKTPQFTPPDIAKRGPGSEVTFNSTTFSPIGGPLRVSYTNYYQPFSEYIKRAFAKLGLKGIAGFNSGELLGFSEFTSSIDPEAGTRSSSETSFLQQAISSTTLQVYQSTLAKKIIFDEKKNAVGVYVETAGKAYSLLATREIIVAAGSVSVSWLTSSGTIADRWSSVLPKCY